MTKRHYKKKKLSIGKTEKEAKPSKNRVTTEVADRDAKGRPISIRQRVIAECVLDSYYIRELISTPQYDAGMRLRKAYLRAVIGIRVEDYGAGAHGDREMGIFTVIESERLLREAYSVISIHEKAVIISVCGHDDWSGGDYRMQFLRFGLDKVAAKWEMV